MVFVYAPPPLCHPFISNEELSSGPARHAQRAGVLAAVAQGAAKLTWQLGSPGLLRVGAERDFSNMAFFTTGLRENAAGVGRPARSPATATRREAGGSGG